MSRNNTKIRGIVVIKPSDNSLGFITTTIIKFINFYVMNEQEKVKKVIK